MQRGAHILIFLMACALGACGQRKPLSGGDRKGVTTLAFELLEEAPAHGSIRAEEVFGPDQSTTSFAIVDEDGQIVDHLELVREDTQQYQASYSRSEGAARTEFLRSDKTGEIVMTAVIDRKENAVSRFSPPLLMMPAELSANQPRTQSVTMRVIDADDPKKVRETGRASRTVTYAADQGVRTAHGVYDAKRIELRFQADLKLAEVDELTVLFVVRGIGIIAEQSTEQVKILGAFGNTTKRTIVRIMP